jgi:hypothetical protein
MELLAEKRAQSRQEYKRLLAAEASLRKRFKEVARRMKKKRRNPPPAAS